MKNIELLKNYSEIITKKLSGLRREFAGYILTKSLINLIIAYISIIFLALVFEGFLFFGKSVRINLLGFLILFGILTIVTPIMLYYLIIHGKFKKYDDFQLSEIIGRKFSDIKDSLLNGLQLRDMYWQKKHGFSGELIVESMKNLVENIREYSFREVIPKRTVRKKIRQMCVISAIIFIIFILAPGYFISSAERLIHPAGEFPIPRPFSIISMTGSTEIMGGDSLDVQFQCRGEFPERLKLVLNFPEYSEEEIIEIDSFGRAEYSLDFLTQDIVYEGLVENHSIFIPWKIISSGKDTIRVINRPEILDVTTKLNFPNYTGMKDKIQESNSTEIYTMPGTEISLNIKANKQLYGGIINFEKSDTKPLKINGNTASIKFYVYEDDRFQIIVSDNDDITNLNPILYRVRITPDAFPLITLLSPKTNIELSESMDIPLGIRISDDFGFSKAVIHYKLNFKYSGLKQREEEIIFPIQNKDLSLQEIFYSWDVSRLNLGPNDAVDFRVDIYDNDIISGPKKSSTKMMSALFPSLNDIFAGIHDQEEEINQEAVEILEQLQTTKKVLEESSRKLFKDPKMKWEQKEELEKQIKKTKEAGEKLSEMGEKLNDLLEQGKENQLFDKETLEKYAKLQETFQNIMSQELKDAMRKLQEALEQMDPKKTQDALKQFQLTQDEFSKQLDRMLELFKRIQIEQSVDELVKRLDELTGRQEQITKEIDKTSPEENKRLTELSNEEKSVKRDSEIAKDIMERTANEMAEFPLMPDEQLRQIAEQMEKMGLFDKMQKASESLQKGEHSEAKQKAQMSQEDLSSLLDMMKQFQQDFKKSNMDEVTSDFERIIGKTLQLSQNQEMMNREIQNTPRQSERLMDVAVGQQQIQQNLAKILDDLVKLSQKTFGVSQNSGKQLGKASSMMQDAIRKMEDRNPQNAAKQGKKATEALNQCAMQLMSSMQSLQQSGSSSGFENYLKQLQKMAGQQDGLNTETMKMGMGKPTPRPGGRQAAMQSLAARQQQIRESLQQLQKEIAQNASKYTGDLSGIAKDMDEVLKDLNSNKVLRRTIQRQQRILSRLLDAQKSMRTQGFKKERKSKTGEDVTKRAPGELPKDLGERRTVLQQNLEKAMQNGYTREYEEMIRRYFEELSDEDIE